MNNFPRKRDSILAGLQHKKVITNHGNSLKAGLEEKLHFHWCALPSVFFFLLTHFVLKAEVAVNRSGHNNVEVLPVPIKPESDHRCER